MGLDTKTLAAAKRYTSETVQGGGAIAGKNVTISSIIPIDRGNRVTFSYTLDSGEAKTSTLDIMNGKDGQNGLDGKSITGFSIDDSNQVTITLSDGSTIQGGTITTLKGDKGDTGLSGRDGTTPQFTIGTVTTLASDQEAIANITGTSANPILNLGIPKGESGSDINSSDEKVKLTSSSTDAHYLEDLLDGSTLQSDLDHGVIYVTKIKDQTVTVAEINFLSGVTSNIQEQINNLGKSMSMYGVFGTKADLIASVDPLPVDGNTAIVIADETNNGKQMTYIYIASTSTWTQVAESTISVRDFTLDPIDLSTETTGILPKEKIDAAIARLANVLDKVTYKGSTDGVVKQADLITGLTHTIAELNSTIENSHTHANKSTLDKIVANGIGNRLLADNGTYKEFIVQSSTQPNDDYCLWVDNTNSTKPILKIFDGTDWIAVSNSSSSNSETSSTSTITVDSAMSDTSTNPVQNKVIKKYVDEKSVEISEDAENAIETKADGLFVEDLSSTINKLNIAQKTVNEVGTVSLLDTPYSFSITPATTAGQGIITNIGVDITLKEDITDFDYIKFLLKVNTTDRDYPDQVTEYKVDTIGYHDSSTVDRSNGSTMFVPFQVISANSVVDGAFHTGIEGWFKDAKTFYIEQFISSVFGETWNTFQISDIIGVKNKSITIDPLEYVNTKNGIEDSPVGHIIAHMGTTAPAHYLICDGSEYNIADYPYLAQHFIDNFGSVDYFGGDGAITFAVPDLRGEFLRGTGTASRNTGSGSNVGIHQEPTQTYHQYIYPNSISWRYDTGAASSDGNVSSKYMDKTIPVSGKIGGISVSANSISSSMTNASYTSRPTNTSVLYCIKYEPTYYMNIEGKDVYSTDEKIIGFWVDNKPLYQKTITGLKVPASTNNQAVKIFVPLSDIDLIVSQDSVFSGTSYQFNGMFFQYNTYHGVKTYYELSSKSLVILNSSSAYNDMDIIVTIKYTKTTD